MTEPATVKPKRKRSSRWWARGIAPDYVSLERHREIYEAVSGDRERYVGFDRRYAKWAKEHGRDTFGST
jgi:hypothetical protein